MVGQLPLEQPIGVRIPGGQPKSSPEPSLNHHQGMRKDSCGIQLLAHVHDILVINRGMETVSKVIPDRPDDLQVLVLPLVHQPNAEGHQDP